MNLKQQRQLPELSSWKNSLSGDCFVSVLSKQKQIADFLFVR
jgi:hypothetical protein